MNKVIMIGNLAADPELRRTQNDIACCTFRIAVQRRFANQQGQREADFFNCVAWRQTGEIISRFFRKGQKDRAERLASEPLLRRAGRHEKVCHRSAGGRIRLRDAARQGRGQRVSRASARTGEPGAARHADRDGHDGRIHGS